MTKAYVIIRGWGEYSGRGCTPVKVYTDRAKAEAIMTALDTISLKYNKLVHHKGFFADYELASKLTPEVKAEYAKLGFDADWSDDWELAEAELCP